MKKNKKVFEHKVEFDIEFTIGDKIHFIYNNERIEDIVSFVHADIQISKTEIDADITYHTEIGYEISSDRAFKTKEDLIEYLLN